MPLIIPARQRALDAFPRSVPWILWVSIMHVCYIFLRDILIFILDGTNGSLPEYVRAIATDTALSEDVVPLLVLGGIFLVMPIISGAFIALVHLLMVRSPKWDTNYRRCFYRTRCRGSASRVPGRFWASWGYSPCSWSSLPL